MTVEIFIQCYCFFLMEIECTTCLNTFWSIPVNLKKLIIEYFLDQFASSSSLIMDRVL